MSSPYQSHELPLVVEEIIDVVCSRFETAWQSGKQPRLEDFVGLVAETERSPLFTELLKVELHYREETRDSFSIEDFQSRFPVYDRVILDVFEEMTTGSRETRETGKDTANPDQVQHVSEDTISYQSSNETEDEKLVHSLDTKIPGYKILEEVGGGGMGFVYKVWQRRAKRVVALKTLKSGALATYSEVRRFQTEVSTVAALEHRHIVPIYEVNVHKGIHYFTMKLIEGGSLKKKVLDLVQDPRTTAHLLAQIARAIHFAHERGILHRDLKPHNVMVEQDVHSGQWEPLVIDFGLAKRVGHNEQGVLVGTAPYMPPEQARGEEVTTAADVYGLGAILYECLTGQAPFKANTFAETLELVCETEPKPPHRVNPSVHKELEAICLKCLEKDPEQRYDSAEEMAEDLEAWLDHRPISLIRLRPTQRLWLWCKRHKTIASLTALLILVLIVGSTTATYFGIVAGHRARQAEWSLYRTNIASAQREWRNGHYLYAQQLLDECPERLRHWEHVYLDQLSGYPEVLKFKDMVWALSWHSDGKQFAAGCNDGSVTVFSFNQRQKEREWPAHAGVVWSVAFGPKGKWENWLATASADKTVKLWKPGRQTPEYRLPHDDEVWSVAFDPTGHYLASGGKDGLVRIWSLENLANAKPIRVLQRRYEVWYVSFSPDGERLATTCGKYLPRGYAGEPGEMNVWKVADLVDASIQEPDPLYQFKGHQEACTCAVYSPSGDLLASSAYDKTTVIHNFKENTMQKLQGHSDRRVICATFSADSRYLATGGWDKTIRLWDLDPKPESRVRVFSGHSGLVSSMAFSPDGKYLLAASGKIGSEGEVFIWDLQVAQPYVTLPNDGDFGEAWCLDFHPHSNYVCCGFADGHVQIWDADSAKKVSFPAHDKGVSAVSFHGNGRYLITGSHDATAILWDIKDILIPKKVRVFEHSLPVLCAAFSPGDHFATGTGDNSEFGKKGSLTIWSIQDNRHPATTPYMHDDSVFGVSYSPDSRFLVSTSGVWDAKSRYYSTGKITIRDAAENKVLREEVEHAGKIHSVVFGPRGQWMATASSDQMVKLWDTSNWRAVRTLDSHSSDVAGLAFSPDGQRLVSAGLDHTVRFWDIVRGEEVLSLEAEDGEFLDVAFSSDGKYIAAANSDGTVRICRGK